MRNIRPRWAPVVPSLSHFQELNLRTYVTDRQGTPGVWFYSLDANSRVAVWWAKTFFELPYHVARMTHRWDRATGRVDFMSQRQHGRGSPVDCRFRYEPAGQAAPASPGSLEFFLVERYVLFTARQGGSIWSGRVHHTPYQICAAQASFTLEGLCAASGLPDQTEPAEHVVMSRGVDVEVFPLQPPAP